MTPISPLGIEELKFAPVRQKNAVVCCSKGAQVTINAQNYTYQDDHRVVPAEDDSNPSKGTTARCCNFFSKVFCRNDKLIKTALKTAENKRAFEILLQNLTDKVGEDTAKSILSDVKEGAPIFKKTVVDALDEAERLRLNEDLKKLKSQDTNTSLDLVEINLQREPSNANPGKPSSLVVTRNIPRTNTTRERPFNKDIISNFLTRTTSADPDTIQKMTQELSEEVTSRTNSDGQIETTTIRKMVVQKIYEKHVPVIPPSHYPTIHESKPFLRIASDEKTDD